MLNFQFDYMGTWVATDAYGNSWEIGVCNDGTFDISHSDYFFNKHNPNTLNSLREAKAECNKLAEKTTQLIM